MKIAIIGTGVYSTALTTHLQKIKNNDIYLWSENEKLVTQFKSKRKFDFLSKALKFDSNVFVSNNLQEVIEDASALFIMTSSKYYLDMLQEIKIFYKKGIPVFVGTKGMDIENIRFFSDITRKTLKCNSYTFFAGPTFAQDLLNKEPFSLTFAGSNKIGYKKLERIIPEYVNIEFTFDLHGLEILSVLKNVYAIGSGILKGLKVSDSTYYTYITNCIKEIDFIMQFLDGETETLITYGGIGDLLMTLNSTSSRNFTLGNLIGSHAKNKEINDYKKNNTIEGLETLNQMSNFLQKTKAQDSILKIIYEIVVQKENAQKLIPQIEEKNDD